MRTSIVVKRSIIAGIGIILLLCVFSQKVEAKDPEMISMYYYAFDESGGGYFEHEDFYFCGDFTQENKASVIFENLFNNSDENKVRFIPEGTKILDIKIKDDILILDVSKEIRNYGGTAYETALVKQLAINALNFDKVRKLTVLIEGRIGVLPEGKLVYNYGIGELLSEI